MTTTMPEPDIVTYTVEEIACDTTYCLAGS